MSRYVRKTRDTFEVHVNYGDGFEHECTEFTRKEAREQIKCYRENCPEYATKIVPKREKLEVFEYMQTLQARRIASQAKLVVPAFVDGTSVAAARLIAERVRGTAASSVARLVRS